MLDSAKTKNVIEATNKPHLFEKLEDLQKRFMFISLHCSQFDVLFSLVPHSILTDWHCVKKLLPNTWRQRDLPFRVSTLFHLQTCWTSSPKEVVPERYIYVEIFTFVFAIYPVPPLNDCICHKKLNDSVSFAGHCAPLKII